MLDTSKESWFIIGDPLSQVPILIGHIQCLLLWMLTIFYVRAQLKEKKIVKRSIIKGYNDVWGQTTWINTPSVSAQMQSIEYRTSVDMTNVCRTHTK